MKKLATLTMAALALGFMSGCQNTDPASRSNRTQYRDIYAEVNGDSNTLHFTVGDGLYASADGGGDTQSNTPTQTTDTKPEIAVGVGGGSAGTGSAKPGGNIVNDAFNKIAGLVNGTNTVNLTAEEAQALKDCVDENCEVK